jgi:sulfite exporter TauE/SafE
MLIGFLLGIVGSLHCVGMCGAMVVAMSQWGLPAQFWGGQVRYHVGKIAGYAVLGALVGLVGKTLSLAFSQQGLSIAVGSVLLLSLVLPAYLMHLPTQNKLTMYLRTAFQNKKSQFVIGFLNAFLPCGLVYVALASALATGEWYDATLFMAMFGLGTMPALLGVAWAGKHLQKLKKNAFLQKIKVQYVLTLCLGAMLLMRGLNLGIPYLSPQITNEAEIECCKVVKE